MHVLMLSGAFKESLFDFLQKLHMPTKKLLFLLPILTACAVPAPPQQPTEATASRALQIEAQKQAAIPQTKTLKLKVAIGRFSNETRYGRTFQVDAENDPLGKQASDMLMNRLVASNKFLVFERQDLGKIKQEQALLKEANLIGVDTLVLGSVTEFGRSATGKSGFLSATKVQTARAKVEIRLADARTGYVFFTATGAGKQAPNPVRSLVLGVRPTMMARSMTGLSEPPFRTCKVR